MGVLRKKAYEKKRKEKKIRVKRHENKSLIKMKGAMGKVSRKEQ